MSMQKKYTAEEQDIRDKESRLRYYLKNKKESNRKSSEWRNAHRKTNRDYIVGYKLLHPCECGENNPCCLSFHHLGHKHNNVCSLAKSPVSLERLKREIKKCKVICENCHRKLHKKEEHEIFIIPNKKELLHIRQERGIVDYNKMYRKSKRNIIRKFIFEYKKDKKCYCGEGDEICFDFHHKTKSKEKNISLFYRDRCNLDRVKKEIEKCEIICANCHRKLHDKDVEEIII